MKNLRLLPFLLSLLFLVECDLIDKIKGLETFDVNVTISDDVPVDITAEDDTTIYKRLTLTPTSHPDIVDYINDISSMELVSASLTTTSFLTEDQDITFTGKVSLGPVSKSYTDLRPADYLGGIELPLSLTQADLDAINADLNADDSIVATVDGYVSGKPVSFVLLVTLDLIVEIETT